MWVAEEKNWHKVINCTQEYNRCVNILLLWSKTFYSVVLRYRFLSNDWMRYCANWEWNTRALLDEENIEPMVYTDEIDNQLGFNCCITLGRWWEGWNLKPCWFRTCLKFWNVVLIVVFCSFCISTRNRTQDVVSIVFRQSSCSWIDHIDNVCVSAILCFNLM